MREVRQGDTSSQREADAVPDESNQVVPRQAVRAWRLFPLYPRYSVPAAASSRFYSGEARSISGCGTSKP